MANNSRPSIVRYWWNKGKVNKSLTTKTENMTANELRIGNLIFGCCEDHMDIRKIWWEPTKITADDIVYFEQLT